MKSDKKTIEQQIKMVLMEAPGQLKVEQITDDELNNHLNTFKERLV